MKKSGIILVFCAWAFSLLSCFGSEDYNTYKCAVTVENYTGLEHKVTVSAGIPCASISAFSGDEKSPYLISAEKENHFTLYYVPGKISSGTNDLEISFSFDNDSSKTLQQDCRVRYRRNSSVSLAIFSTKLPANITESQFSKITDEDLISLLEKIYSLKYTQTYCMNSRWTDQYKSYEEYNTALKILEKKCAADADIDFLSDEERSFVMSKDVSDQTYYIYYD